MKLIARKDFRNNVGLKIADPLHDHHVHKGATFEMDEKDADQEQTIALLNAAGCIADATNEKAVKAIQAEVAADAKKAKQSSPTQPQK